MQTTKPLLTKEGLTVVVGFPKNIVAVLEPKEVVGFFETVVGKILILFLIVAAIVWYIVYPIWIPIKWFLYGRDPSTRSGQVRAWFDPPKTSTGRFLTAGEGGGGSW